MTPASDLAVEPVARAPIGSRDELRGHLAEAAEMAGIQAGLLVTFAEVDDLTGAAYAARRLIAYTKFIAGILRDIDAGQGASDAG